MSQINNLLQQILAGDKEIARASRLISEDTYRRKYAAIGARFDLLLSSRGLTFAALTDADAAVRKVAMSLFISHWNADSAVEEICARQAFSGPHDVRTAAISALAFVRNHLYGKKVSQTLADFALDTSLEWRIRRSVYSTIVMSMGSPEQREAELRIAKTKKAAEWLEGVDPIDIAVIQQCIEADPSAQGAKIEGYKLEAVNLYEAGKNSLAEGRAEQAEKLFNDAIQKWPGTAGPLIGRAQARVMLGRGDEAISDCTAAIALAPRLANSYRHRAMIYERLGMADLALADNRKAESLDR